MIYINVNFKEFVLLYILWVSYIYSSLFNYFWRIFILYNFNYSWYSFLSFFIVIFYWYIYYIFCNYPMVLGYSVLFFSFFFLQFNWLSLHWYIFKFTDSSAQSSDETIKDISVTVTLKSIIILQIFFFSFDLSAYTIHCWLYLLVLLIHKS